MSSTCRIAITMLAGVLALCICAPGAATGSKASRSLAPAAGERILVINDGLNRWEPVAAAAGFRAADWRERFETQLSLLPPMWLQMFDQLHPLASGNPRAEYARFTQFFVDAQANLRNTAAKAPLKLGSATSDLVFQPIPPCRIVDTRNTGALLSAGAGVSFYYYSDGTPATWASQGGVGGAVETACPGSVLNIAGGTLGAVAPAAVAATITVVAPTAAGNFAVWGGGAPVPATSVLNWNAGEVLANTTVIPGGGRSGGSLDFTVLYNGPSGQAHVVVDIVGYYVENTATPLQCNTLLAVGNGNVASGAATTIAVPACTAGYTRTGGGCSTSAPVGPDVYLQQDSSNAGNCVYLNNSASTMAGATFRAESVCCRVPGQ